MPRKKHRVEEIIGKLREAEVGLGAGSGGWGRSCGSSGVSEQTYYRWRREYGGLKVDQAKRLKELERENARLKRVVADQALDNADPAGGCRGKLLSPARRRRGRSMCWKKFEVSERRACAVARAGPRRRNATRRAESVTRRR